MAAPFGLSSLRTALFAVAGAVLLAISTYGVLSVPSYPGLGFVWSEDRGVVTIHAVGHGKALDHAGVRPGDVILSVDELSPVNGAQLELLMLDKAPGDTVTLRLARDGQTLSVPIVLITRHGTGLIVVSSVLGVLLWAIALLVYAQRSSEYAARIFAFTMIMLGATIMMVWPGYPHDGGVLGMVPPLLYLTAYSLIPASMLLFFLVYPRRKAILTPRVPILLFIPALGFGSVLCFHYLRAIITRSPGDYAAYLRSYGPFRLYFALHLVLSLIALMHSRVRAQTKEDRHKVQWILLGIVAGGFPFIALWSLPQALGGAPLISEEATYLFMMLIPVSFAFSIVRYHALNIEVIVSRGIGYAVVSGLIIAAYLAIAGTAGVLLHSSVTRGGRFILVGCTLLAALIFAPLRRRVQDVVDRTFYRTRYNYRIAMQNLSAAVKVAPVRHDVFEILLEKVIGAVPMGALAVAVCDPESGTVSIPVAVGLDPHGCQNLEAFLDSLHCATADIPLPDTVLAAGIHVVLPIGIQGNVLGYVATGSRLSGGGPTDDDLDLVRAMAEEAFMATERLHLQEAVILEHAEAEKLGELNRLKSEFIVHVSHELRTPLTSIRWSVENLLDGIPEPSGPRVREYLVGIHESSTHLAHMIENLLNTTRVDAGRVDLVPEPLDVCDTVKAAVDVVRPVAEKKQVTLRTVCAEGLGITSDRHSMQTILINLIDNAVKYSPGGTTVTVESRAAHEGEHLPCAAPAVALVVSDQGAGIPPDRLESIFEPFERIRHETAARERGLGLGLHIVKQLVTRLEGRIMVESTPGVGSTFVVLLPPAPMDDD